MLEAFFRSLDQAFTAISHLLIVSCVLGVASSAAWCAAELRRAARERREAEPVTTVAVSTGVAAASSAIATWLLFGQPRPTWGVAWTLVFAAGLGAVCGFIAASAMVIALWRRAPRA